MDPANNTSVRNAEAELSSIRIRTTMDHRWVWDLLTDEGHVASTSEAFASRDECEDAALREGLPVKGLSKAKKGAAKPKKTVPSGWTVTATSGLWRWRRYGDE